MASARPLALLALLGGAFVAGIGFASRAGGPAPDAVPAARTADATASDAPPVAPPSPAAPAADVPRLAGRPSSESAEPDRPAGEAPDAEALRTERVAAEVGLRHAIERHEAGHVSVEEVDDAKLRLAWARRRLGEIEEKEFRSVYRETLERRAVVAERLAEAGFTPVQKAEIARLRLERARFEDGLENDYGTRREAVLRASRERGKLLVENGHVSADSALDEAAMLEAAFPPSDRVRAAR